MKTDLSFFKGKKHFITSLMASILATSLIFMLVGCSTTTETDKDTSPTSKDSTSKDSASEDHIVDPDPTPLNSTEKELSLEGYGAKGALSDKSLTINDMLMYAVQDEYLAHGEYEAIIDKFGSQKPYTNIIGSEETHLAYLKEVYISYGLDFPSDSSKEHLVIPNSLLEAAKTGVQAEVDNIAMYKLFLTKTLPQNVQEVFTALMKASESHLAAFQKQVDKLQ